MCVKRFQTAKKSRKSQHNQNVNLIVVSNNIELQIRSKEAKIATHCHYQDMSKSSKFHALENLTLSEAEE